MVGGGDTLWLPDSANLTSVGFVLRIWQSNAQYTFSQNVLPKHGSDRSCLTTPIQPSQWVNNLCLRSVNLPYVARFKTWLREQIKILTFAQWNRHGGNGLRAALRVHRLRQFNCLSQELWTWKTTNPWSPSSSFSSYSISTPLMKIFPQNFWDLNPRL